MNGDTGKMPAGAVYHSPESIIGPNPGTGLLGGSAPQLMAGINSSSLQGADFSTMNGAVASSSNDGVEYYTDNLNDNNASNTMANINAGITDVSTIPLDQLKQLLSTQLEYYFSR